MPTTENLTLQTSDGEKLEAELGSSAGDPIALMVLCHPHPLHGGNMHAGVIDGLFREMPGHDVTCLRFNFRGAGASTGSHDEGRAETLDVVAAIDALGAVNDDRPLLVAGWSFGSDVSLAVDHPRHSGWFGIAPPLRIVSVDDMAAPADDRPKVLAVPEHDQFNPPEAAAETTASWINTSQWVVPGADHFLAGGQSRVTELALMAVEAVR